MNDFKQERKQVAKFMRRLYDRQLTTAGGGNVSLRNDDGLIFITAGQTDKAKLTWQQVIVIDSSQQRLAGELNPSMETGMHCRIYALRPDVRAIVHAHPVYATTFAITDLLPDTAINGEAFFTLGKIKCVDYHRMGSDMLAKATANILKNANVAIMKNHGAIAVGTSLFEAFNRLEVLENTAHIYFNTLLLQQCNTLNINQLAEIANLAKK